MKIAFLDFWHDFNINNNFFTHMISSVMDGVEISNPNDCDILFFSCYGNLNERYKNKIRVFYTGENLRRVEYLSKLNYMSNCDICLSFDFDEDDKKIRLPLWVLQIDWFGKINYSNPKFTIDPKKIRNNDFYNKEKNKFCSIVYNGPSPYRSEIINKLSKYKLVDVYGNRYGNIGDGEDKKLDVISEYKFNICFENSIFPGYYTEKLLHAKVAGCVPIYWSDENISVDFNEKCLINLSNFKNLNEMIDFIIKVDKNDEEFNRIRNEMLFSDEEYPRILFDNIVLKFKNKVENLI